MLSVTEAPDLADGFTDTFTSRFVDVGGVALHAVVGGDGPPLLLLAGWPQTWYAWRLLMPSLAREYSLVVPDGRGVGLSDKPEDCYDTGTLAADMVGLMGASGTSGSRWWGTTSGCGSGTRWPWTIRRGSNSSRWRRR